MQPETGAISRYWHISVILVLKFPVSGGPELKIVLWKQRQGDAHLNNNFWEFSVLETTCFLKRSGLVAALSRPVSTGTLEWPDWDGWQSSCWILQNVPPFSQLTASYHLHQWSSSLWLPVAPWPPGQAACSTSAPAATIWNNIWVYTSFRVMVGTFLPHPVLAGMLCFELDPPEHLQCRELHHQIPFSFCPCLTPSQGSLSSPAAALALPREGNSLWEGAAQDSQCSRCRVAAAAEDAGAAQHTLLLTPCSCPAQCASTQQGTPSLGNKLAFTAQGWGGAGRAGEWHSRATKPQNCTSDSELCLQGHVCRLCSARTEGGREAEVLSALSVGAGPHPSQRQTQLCCDLLPCRNVHQLWWAGWDVQLSSSSKDLQLASRNESSQAWRFRV